MKESTGRPVVHLELHTRDLARACAFYARLFGWRPETVQQGPHVYTATDLGRGLGGGIVDCGSDPACWLPYVEVADLGAATAEAVALGAEVMLAPREGPAGWRSVVSVPAGGEVALWQPKR